MPLKINKKYKDCCINWLSDYWLCGEGPIYALPILSKLPTNIVIPVKLVEIKLPDWATHIGVNGAILIPIEANPASNAWNDVNWWYVIYWYVTCQAEQEHERKYGSVHSYSINLKGWDGRMWDHAWVNRIAIFLDLWAQFSGFTTIKKNRTPELIITHDLDAIEKTWSIRFKQTAFNLFNSIRFLLKMEFRISYEKLIKAFHFFFSNENYNYLYGLYLDRSNNLISRQIINVYGGHYDSNRGIKSKIIDPDYDISALELVRTLNDLHRKGVEIGLHQSIKAWNDYKIMSEEREYIKSSLGIDIQSCRQHWLKFSFKDTWRSQSEAGLLEDMTLGFNNRIAFRNGCALSVDISKDSHFHIKNVFHVLPMVLMDSHLYDYEVLNDEKMEENIKRVLTELKQVRGAASVIWHPHTLGSDYGWRNGYKMLNTLSKELYSNE